MGRLKQLQHGHLYCRFSFVWGKDTSWSSCLSFLQFSHPCVYAEALLKLQRKIIVAFVGCNLYVSESLTKNNTCGDDGINGNTDGPWEIPSGVQKYTFSELAKATGNFSEANEIGAGGFGKVFYGTLDGKMVAIKRASQQSLQGTTEFRNEVLLLSRLHHRHLVRLEGFCDDKGLQVLAGIL